MIASRILGDLRHKQTTKMEVHFKYLIIFINQFLVHVSTIFGAIVTKSMTILGCFRGLAARLGSLDSNLVYILYAQLRIFGEKQKIIDEPRNRFSVLLIFGLNYHSYAGTMPKIVVKLQLLNFGMHICLPINRI